MKNRKPQCNENLPEWARGRLAGLIDGEGTITVKYHKRGIKYNIQPRTVINNSSLELLKKVREILGCGTIVRQHEKRDRNWKPIWRLEIKGSFVVYAVLKQTFMYLTAKRQQAEIVMKICEENIKAYSKCSCKSKLS